MTYIFQEGERYYLVELDDNGVPTLKVKEHGWSDTWSLPVKQVRP